jgi:hypothetical protein
MHSKDLRRGGESEQRVYGVAALVWSIAVINTWNRVAVTARDPVPGTYEPR